MVVDIRDGETSQGVFMCIEKSIQKTKAGKDYASLVLRDKTGSIDAKIWDLNNGIEGFEKGCFVSVGYSASVYNGNLQLSVKTLHVLNRDSVEIEDYCPTTELDVEKMWKCVKGLLACVEDDWYQKVLGCFVDDEEWVKKFKKHSAAVRVHHAYVGGLLQHTLFVMRICNSLASIYSLDKSLLLTAAFLHDVGKMEEINEFPENDYSDNGSLIGHVSEGAYQIRKVCESIPDFPKQKMMNLVHCILAHHGQLEYGSPKVPCIAEAVALSFADNTDAKMEMVCEELNSSEQKWNKYLGTIVLPTEREE